MTRTFLFLWLAAAAFAQEPAKPAEEAKPATEAAKPAEEAKPAEQAAAPAAEPPVTGSVEIGYRFTGDIRGNADAYRSVVNLGEGPRLVNLDLSMSPSLKWIDELAVRANSWGDPYNTAYLRAGKQGAYRLTVDYRNIAYFNALPSFANPNLERGILQSEHTFDIKRRYADVDLELFPTRRIIPFVAYTHDSGGGRGVTTYVPSGNEYAVPTNLRDSTNTYRGGARVEMNRFHATVEQVWFHFKDDQQVYEAQRNLGNRTTSFLGQTLLLQNLQQSYRVRGDAWFTRAYASANPASWIDLSGSFVHTQPDINTRYWELANGQFAQTAPVAFFTAQQALYSAVASQPHNRASASAEVRPMSRLRVIESFYLDRIDTTGQLGGTEGTAQTNVNVPGMLKLNQQQNQLEALVEVTDKLTLRGGHRYTWGDAETMTPEVTGTPGTEKSKLRRNTALAGINYRFAQRLTANVDAEVASTDKAWFRTSLMDYQRIRARVRYAASSDWSVMWSGAFLNNSTPNTAVPLRLGNYDLVTIDNSVSFFYTPKGGDKFRAMGEYARQSWKSDILYLAPQLLSPERSLYRENVHAANVMIDVKPRKGAGWAPRLSAGGSMFRSTGSRPTQYYQPVVRVAVPTVRKVEFIGEWRWWGMSEPYYGYENFRMHQGMISLRIWQ